MREGACRRCGYLLCFFCGECHTEGCRLASECCDQAILASLGELAAEAGYVVSMGFGVITLRRGTQEHTFYSSSAGLREAEGWLRTMVLCGYLNRADRVTLPKLVGGLRQWVREVFGWA